MSTQIHEIASGVTQDQEMNKFLSFFLGKEEYGIEILKVREIIGMMEITEVPRTPDYIRGVLNLRGKVIPVVDLRLKFGMVAVEQTEETCIIVVDTDDGERGTIVDKVSEVLDIVATEIEPTPSFGGDVRTDYILGIGKSDDRVKLLLDIDRALEDQDVIDIQAAIGGEETQGLVVASKETQAA